MKEITFTKEHQEKLLRICRVSLPQYDEYTYWGSDDYVGMYHIINGEESTDDNVSIHWYEFCHTHLVDQLFNHAKTNRQEPYDSLSALVDMVRGQEFNPNYHTVDYLYEQFLKL